MYTGIVLVKKNQTLDAYGDLVTTYTRRSVFAEELSVGMSEVYQAMAVGFKPEAKFRLENWCDYQGEELVEHRPFNSQNTYVLRVLRTYRDGDRLDLVCYAGNDRPTVTEPEEGENNGGAEEPGADQLQEGTN